MKKCKNRFRTFASVSELAAAAAANAAPPDFPSASRRASASSSSSSMSIGALALPAGGAEVADDRSGTGSSEWERM